MTAGEDLAARNGSLALAAMRGDRGAMELLWHQHRRWVAAVLLAHKSAADQLDDLLQEVAMTFVTRIDSLREPEHLRAWLRTVAINTARASARSARARPWHRTTATTDDGALVAGAAEGDVVATPGPGGDLDDEARRLLLEAEQIPEAYREPLMLRALHGMSGRHIAAIMGLPEATVETRIARARRMLRARLEQRDEEQGAAPQSARINHD